MLLVNRRDLDRPMPLFLRTLLDADILRETTSLILDDLEYRFPFPFRGLKEMLRQYRSRGPADDRPARIETVDASQSISKLSRSIFQRLDWAEATKKRRENFAHILEAADRSGAVRVPFDRLPEGVVPMGIPLLVEPGSPLPDRLARMGIPFLLWPDLPDAVAEASEYSKARILSRSLLLLPVHQGLRPRDLERMVRAFLK
jgi:hypothetical protein